MMHSLTLSYDSLGRLHELSDGSVTRQFLYDGDALIAEYDGASISRRFVHGPGVDEPVVQYEGADLNTRIQLFADRQGSIIATNGAATTTYRYGPYGETDNWSGSRFRYTGQIVLDPNLGTATPARFYHYKARVFDPVEGRFLQTDPVGYEDDLNLYAYVRNDPMNQTDPTGRCPACQQLTDLFLGVVHGSGQSGFVGVSNDVAVGTGYTMAGGAYFQQADPTSLHVGLYGNMGPAAGLALSVQAEVGILEGDRSNLVGGAVESSAGLGAVSATRGQTLGPDGGVPYTAVAVGPSARLPVTNAPLPGPVTSQGRGRAYAFVASRDFAYAYGKSRQDRQSLQTDPVGYEDDLNLYMYVSNDPLNGVDPTGRQEQERERYPTGWLSDPLAPTVRLVNQIASAINDAINAPSQSDSSESTPPRVPGVAPDGAPVYGGAAPGGRPAMEGINAHSKLAQATIVGK